MGTRYSVRVPRADPADQEALAALIRGELDAVDRAMSTWKEDSELSRLNRAATEPVALSAPTLEVLQRALEIAADTGGAFDLTVGPLVDAWGFGPEGVVTAVPSEHRLAELQRLTGRERLVIDAAASTVTKSDPAVEVDLSAIAKGYAVDRVAAALEAAGHPELMVEVGGEVVTRGRPEPDRAWRIGIENPRGGIHRLLPLEDAALASSGNYRNFYELDGRTVAHTIDPRSGRPVEHLTVAVTVLAADCATADALATAMMVLGPEEGLAWAEARGLAVLFLVEESGAVRERASAPFLERFGAL